VFEKDQTALIKMRQSKLFGEKELILLEKRIKGDKKDPTGLWSRKVKPKVTEIVNQWLPRKTQLEKVVKLLHKNHQKKSCLKALRFD